ncbi:MAG: acetate kinase, partial [Oscillospiraceae bacterium]|nr:acetate kinase [Oscillospiraceae bacterium]
TILEYLMGRYGYDIKEMLNILNKKSGVLGISGVSSDFRDLDDAAAKGNERAQLALDKFIYEVKKFIGAYASAMGGVDAIVFTAGIGENSVEMREQICQGLEYLGAKMDTEKNKVRGKETDVSADGSKVKIFVIPTNEELMIAMDTAALCGK